jgi:hypothetical protein
VTESKENTNRVLEQYRHMHELPRAELLAEEGALRLYGDAALRLTRGGDGLENELRRHLARVRPHGYYGLQAYLAPTAGRSEALRGMATLLRDRTRRAVTLGYGPRFLHSTGQLHKGGANNGIFLQLTCDDPVDMDVPGEAYSFSVLKQAQAQGDLEALRRHGRRVARVHLGQDVVAGLAALERAVSGVLARKG